MGSHELGFSRGNLCSRLSWSEIRPRHLGNRHLRDCPLREARRFFKFPQVLFVSGSAFNSDKVEWAQWHLRDFIEFRDSFEVVPRAPSTWYVPGGCWQVTK